MAGGKLVSQNISQQVPDVTMEQVISWNPDIIIMGRMNNTQLVMNDPKWKDINAVKNGKVYVNPNGVMYWDYSSEGILLLEYLAKTFYPDKFADLDMKTEVKEYYTKFYHYNLTDDEVNRILNYLRLLHNESRRDAGKSVISMCRTLPGKSPGLFFLKTHMTRNFDEGDYIII